MKILDGNIRRVRCLAFTPDGATLAASGLRGGYARGVALWNWGQSYVRRYPHFSGSDVPALAVSRGGEWVAAGDRVGTLRLCAIANGLDSFTPRDRGGAVLALDFAPDDAALVSVSSAEGLTFRGHPQADLWSVVQKGRRATLTAAQELSCARFAPDGRTVALGTRYGTVLLWDVESPPQEGVYPPEGGSCPPGVRRLCLPEKVPRPAKRHEADVRHVAFTPDGRTLIAVLGTMVATWDPARGALLSACAGHPRVIRTAALSPDGRTLAVAHDGGIVRLIDPATGAERASYNANLGSPSCLAFAPDGMTLAVGCGKAIVIWDVDVRD